MVYFTAASSWQDDGARFGFQVGMSHLVQAASAAAKAITTAKRKLRAATLNATYPSIPKPPRPP
jgi:hypothetical protein